jgi:type IV pilus assembly protein PilQ
MVCSRIAGLTLLLGIASCAHQPAAARAPAPSAAVASASSTDNPGFSSPDASRRTFLHPTSASQEPRITVTYQDSDIRDVIAAFAVFSGRTIVAGHDVKGSVTVEVHDVPWDIALQSILTRDQLVASESQEGIITVHAE